NNIRNHVAIRSLHDGTHIAGQPAYNKVGENNRLRLKTCPAPSSTKPTQPKCTQRLDDGAQRSDINVTAYSTVTDFARLRG
ncbi:hypothetical protein ABIB82_007800, partial [Bradyrhizobium sp. i1.8.4]|uniref:hypothetical protein n=1 Tax=unclassified Bradyrhizobium TaxID=2631580 RepID=UPI003D2371C0